MPDFLVSIAEWIDKTQVFTQIAEIDAKGLFQNPYFLVPFICLIIYFLYKQAFNNLMITALLIAMWWFSGTGMVRGAIVGGELQLSKILPVVGVGIAAVATLVYLLFMRND